MSIDPIFDSADPQSWNGYVYAVSSPETKSDPSGTRACDGDDCRSHPVSNIASSTTTSSCQRRCTTGDIVQITFPKIDQKRIDKMTHPGDLGTAWLNEAMAQAEDFYDKSGGWAKTRSTVQLALVNVNVNGKSVPRVVGFVSSAGIDEKLRSSLESSGVFLYQARPGTGRSGRGHAEAAAAAFGQDSARQVRDLGGAIESVDAFVGTVKVCSGECAADANEFLRPRNQAAKITQDSFGSLFGHNMDDAYMAGLRGKYGSGTPFRVAPRAIDLGEFRIAGPPGGGFRYDDED